MNQAAKDQNDSRAAALAELRELTANCMQCGTCSASCPNVAAMDVTPRRLWRLAQLGFAEEAAATKAFWLCSACFNCTLHCPRGLPTTRIMYALKRLNAASPAGTFYRTFTEHAVAWGRVQESALMNTYLRRKASPLLALSYVPMGLKLLRRGKLHAPHGAHRGVLRRLAQRVQAMESGAKEVRP